MPSAGSSLSGLAQLAGQPQSQDWSENRLERILASEGARPFLIPQRHLLAAKPAPDGLAALSGLDRFLIPQRHLSGLDRFLIPQRHLSGLDRFAPTKPGFPVGAQGTAPSSEEPLEPKFLEPTTLRLPWAQLGLECGRDSSRESFPVGLG
jgi:hypothetical protein